MRLASIQLHRLKVGSSEKKATATTLRILKRDLPLRAFIYFHIAARVSWWGKSKRLRFYNDEEDKVKEHAYPQKPCRRPKTGEKEEYTESVREREAGKPHKVKVEF